MREEQQQQPTDKRLAPEQHAPDHDKPLLLVSSLGVMSLKEWRWCSGFEQAVRPCGADAAALSWRWAWRMGW
jgi:hypothetical protein